MIEKVRVTNGWTIASMKAQILKYNKGTQALGRVKDGDYTCMYKTPDGNRCVIGCFIPDNHPAQGFLGDVGNLLEKYPHLRGRMPFNDKQTLYEFQTVHDTCSDTYKAVFEWIDKWIEDNPDTTAMSK